MGFDANSEGKPIVNVHKKTTQVNLWMVVGVALFFVVSATVTVWISKRHGPDDHPNTPELQTQP